jgi:diaminopimelate decarboxylase
MFTSDAQQQIEGPAWFDNEVIDGLVAAEGTPFLVMSLPRVRANATRISAALLREVGVQARQMYAVKSCYLTDVIETLHALGWGFEVMSDFELTMLLEQGIEGRELILTGLGWGDELCVKATEAGVRRFVVDTAADLASLVRASDPARPSGVLLRLNLGDSFGNTFFGADAKLGQSLHALTSMAVMINDIPELRLEGLHLHQFNRLADGNAYDAALVALSVAVATLRDQGISIEEVDFGGGLESIARLDGCGQPVEDFFSVLGRNVANTTGLSSVVTEFGRAVVGDAAAMISRVVAVKEAEGRCWVVLDASTNTLVPIPGAVFDPVLLTGTAGRPMIVCSFTDGTGSPVGFAHDVTLPRPEVGDLVLLTECGAYTTVFSELWAAALPTVVILQCDGSYSVRSSDAVTRNTYKSWYSASAWRSENLPGTVGESS